MCFLVRKILRRNIFRRSTCPDGPYGRRGWNCAFDHMPCSPSIVFRQGPPPPASLTGQSGLLAREGCPTVKIHRPSVSGPFQCPIECPLKSSRVLKFSCLPGNALRAIGWVDAALSVCRRNYFPPSMCPRPGPGVEHDFPMAFVGEPAIQDGMRPSGRATWKDQGGVRPAFFFSPSAKHKLKFSWRPLYSPTGGLDWF